MNLEDFFDFNSKLIGAYFSASPKGKIKYGPDLENSKRVYKLEIGDYSGLEFPVIFTHTDGKKMMDIMDTGWPSLYNISDKVKQLLIENNITGWKTYPIKILTKKGEEVLGYNGFSITGRCNSRIKYDKTQLIEKRLIKSGPIVTFYKGLIIDLTKWDGSDFFICEENRTIFTSLKVRNIFTENQITNMMFRNITEIETDEYIVKKFG
jgi:hypothetical protein